MHARLYQVQHNRLSLLKIYRQIMKLLVLLVLLQLLELILRDATTQVHLDIPASLNFGNGPRLLRVEKVVDIDYVYNLHSGGIWGQFPDIKIIIDLPFAQYVKLHYNIAIVHHTLNHLATRIKIDGLQNRHTRRHTADIRCPSVFYDSEIYMGKGKHTIVLEYRAMINHHQNPKWDWSIALFQVSQPHPRKSMMIVTNKDKILCYTR